MASNTTELEKTSLEAHVDLCAIRYQQLDNRLTSVEKKMTDIHEDMREGQTSLIKVLIGATSTIIAGLLSTVIVILMKF